MEASFREIEKELQRFPITVLEEYRRATAVLEPQLEEADRLAWAQEGLTIARQTVRSWEAASEYFRVSPEVVRLLLFPHLLQWAQSGSALCQESPTVSVAYFRASPGSVALLRPRHIPSWAAMGRGLYKGTWKSSALASKFFEVSPHLLRHLSPRELEMFVGLVEALSYKSYDLAAECLHLGQQVFPQMRSDREAFITLATSLVDYSWREVKGCFEATHRVVGNVHESQRVRFFLLAERLARHGVGSISHFLIEGAQSLGVLGHERHQRVLDLAEALARSSLEAVPPFLRSVPPVLERITDAQLEAWFQQGLHILQDNPEGGIAYFKLESSRCEQALETLSSTVELERIQGIMRMYCRALAGASVDIEASSELAGKGIGWVSSEHPSTEGTKVFLPAAVDRYPDKRGNFSWFKVVATHQVAHLEFGSFLFDFDRPSNMFEDLRPGLAQGQLVGTVGEGRGRTAPPEEPQAATADSTAERGWITDMERFFDMFENRKLVLDIFTAVEDGRLDYLVKRGYRGIAQSYNRIQGEALEERPPMELMPLQRAMVELLVRLSLQQGQEVPVPREYAEETRILAAVAQRLLDPRATVEDTAEASIRAYSIISLLPNPQVPQEEWESQDLQDAQFTDEELENLLSQLQQRRGGQEEEQEGESYESPPQVEYRGDFKPELAQLLSMLKEQDGKKDGESQTVSLTREQLEELLRKSAELEAEQGQVSQTVGTFVDNLMKEAGLQPPPDTPGQGHGRISHHEEEGGPLQTKEPNTYVYDEWDFRAEDYKPRWCIVREKAVAEGDSQFFTDTLRSYSGMMAQIRRQFEMLVPEMFRKVKHLEDGEDVELDALIEAKVDIKAGTSPSERVYWRRNKVQRDVAVVFLLDMSASTAEAIDEAKRMSSDWDAPDDPVEYMIWLRSRRGEGIRRSYKRIIDVEKESMVLLTTALETIGDAYGIYGFSGYGRENVEFYVIKDIDDQFGEKAKRRIDKISPLHATRMGPAIRHATSKLEQRDAKTKILFLISDGRPQDRGYSREGVEKEYAVHDTKMALIEARRSAITTFALTVDKAGHDYLKTMCSDMGYEVLADITMLPQRLPYLYRRLTL